MYQPQEAVPGDYLGTFLGIRPWRESGYGWNARPVIWLRTRGSQWPSS